MSEIDAAERDQCTAARWSDALVGGSALYTHPCKRKGVVYVWGVRLLAFKSRVN